MKLIYKIEFKSTNSYYKMIIESLVEEFRIDAQVKQCKGYILIICDDSEQKIEDFFKYLGENLPLSIFMGKSEVVDFYDESQVLKEQDVIQNVANLSTSEIKRILKFNSEIDFSNGINKIKNGDILKLETHNGYKDIFLPSKKIREDFEAKGEEVKLLICDLSKVQELVSVNQKDLQLLCSIERPLVKLKFTILNNQNKEYSSTDFIYAKLPDDKETILFANALKNSGISYIPYVKEESLQDGIKVTYFNDENIIVSGDKSLFPKYDYNLDEKYISSKEFFDKNGGVPKATIKALNKRIKPIIGVYFSRFSNESSIFVNIPGKGFKEIICIPNAIYDIENGLDEISSIDENTLRLVENYKKKFSEFFEIKLPKEDANGFETIMDFCAYILGYKDAKEFENLAFQYNSKSGIQIDMKLLKIDGVNYLDYRKIVQSIMSYKMADVDNRMLAYSFFESLSDLIKNNINDISKEINTKDVILCGDMFDNSILLSKVYDGLNKTFDILIAKDIPLDYGKHS